MKANRIRTIAASAVLALSLLSGAAVAPALAEDDAPISHICWEMTIGGKTTTECDTVENIKAECALADPENTSDECAAAAAAYVRPVRGLGEGAPQSLSDGEDNDGVTLVQSY